MLSRMWSAAELGSSRQWFPVKSAALWQAGVVTPAALRHPRVGVAGGAGLRSVRAL